MPLTGYEIRWYPMRMTYNRELKIKALLDELPIECFVPMQYVLEESDGIPKKNAK